MGITEILGRLIPGRDLDKKGGLVFHAMGLTQSMVATVLSLNFVEVTFSSIKNASDNLEITTPPNKGFDVCDIYGKIRHIPANHSIGVDLIKKEIEVRTGAFESQTGKIGSEIKRKTIKSIGINIGEGKIIYVSLESFQNLFKKIYLSDKSFSINYLK